MTENIIYQITKSEYLKLPDHWDYISGVMKKNYEDNHLLYICFIDKTRSEKERNIKPTFYEMSFNIDWLYPDDTNKMEWLASVLSRSLFENIKKAQNSVRNEINFNIDNIVSVLRRN